MTTTKKQAPAKTIVVTARYELKRNHSVIYQLKNEAGKAYQVTINECGRPSCTDETGEACKGNSFSRNGCYHVANCLNLEKSRRASEEDQDRAAYETWKREQGLPDRLDRAAYEQEFNIYG
jgi:hypothetical protein